MRQLSSGITVVGLPEENELRRYMSFSQFIAFVESQHITLSQVSQWDDTWEVSKRKVYSEEKPLPNDYVEFAVEDDPEFELLFAQCWSQSNEESDAMWRIYSRNNEGLMITTAVKKFNLIRGLKYAKLSPVDYSSESDSVYIPSLTQSRESLIDSAFEKRLAFKHEEEVRLLTLNNEECLEHAQQNVKYIKLPLNPREFIESITIDPRASDWYVETIINYCARANFTIVPKRSELYSPMEYPPIKVQYSTEDQPDK